MQGQDKGRQEVLKSSQETRLLRTALPNVFEKENLTEAKTYTLQRTTIVKPLWFVIHGRRGIVNI